MKNQAIERVQALADISRSGHVVTATKPVDRLHIRPILHNWRAPIPFPQLTSEFLHAVVWVCGEGQTDGHTHTQIHRRAWPIFIWRRLQLTRNLTSQTFWRVCCPLRPNAACCAAKEAVVSMTARVLGWTWDKTGRNLLKLYENDAKLRIIESI